MKFFSALKCLVLSPLTATGNLKFFHAKELIDLQRTPQKTTNIKMHPDIITDTKKKEN